MKRSATRLAGEFAVLAPITAHEIKLLVRKIRKILTDIFNSKDCYILIFTILINGTIQERISTLEVGYFSGGLWTYTLRCLLLKCLMSMSRMLFYIGASAV